MWSTGRLRLTAEITPSGTAATKANATLANVSSTVAGRRSIKLWRTGRLVE